MLPVLAAAGGAMALGGIAGSYLSGSTKGPRKIDPVTGYDPNASAYQVGGSAAEAERWRRELLMRGAEAEGRLDTDVAAQRRALAGLEAAAAGQGPSVAVEQMKEGQAQATARQAALAAGASGGPGARIAAERNAQRIGAEAALDTNRAAAQVRANEQIAARSALAGLSTSMRNSSQAGEQAAMGDRLGLENTQLNAAMGLDANRMRADQWTKETNVGIEKANIAGEEEAKKRKAALWGGLTSAGSSMLGMGLGGGGKLWPGPDTALIPRRAPLNSRAMTGLACAPRRLRRHFSRRGASTCSRKTRVGPRGLLSTLRRRDRRLPRQ